MPAYVIVELSVTDAATYERYKPVAEASVAAYGGTYKVRGGRTEQLEGERVPDRLIVLEFPDLATARAWYNSPEYAEARDLAPAAFRGRMLVFVEGVKTNQMPGGTKPPAYP